MTIIWVIAKGLNFHYHAAHVRYYSEMEACFIPYMKIEGQGGTEVGENNTLLLKAQ